MLTRLKTDNDYLLIADGSRPAAGDWGETITASSGEVAWLDVIIRAAKASDSVWISDREIGKQ